MDSIHAAKFFLTHPLIPSRNIWHPSWRISKLSSLIVQRIILNFGNAQVVVIGISTKLSTLKPNPSGRLLCFQVNFLGTLARKLNAMTSSVNGRWCSKHQTWRTIIFSTSLMVIIICLSHLISEEISSFKTSVTPTLFTQELLEQSPILCQ